MPMRTDTRGEARAIEAEQVKAYFNDAGILNVAGAAVFSLMVLVIHNDAPWWSWSPALAFLYLVSLYRANMIRRYRKSPQSRSSKYWIHGQALTGGLAGLCWGVVNTVALFHLPFPLQLFVTAVSSVVAAAATLESFLLVLPPRLFTFASITPLAVGLLFIGDFLFTMLALMLFLFLPVTVVLGNRKNGIFIEAQRLRFQNETLVKELSRQHELLEGASSSKSRFLAAASHDLRQPLAALMIFLELLETERQMSQKGKSILEHAQKATSSLRDLLDALLDISKLDAKAIKPDIRALALQNIFNELDNEFAPVAEHKGIRLRFSATSALVFSDFTLLNQILRNLISNALRYTPSGCVLVGCRHRHGKLCIEVHDTGIGIAENQLGRVFDEFYQVDNQERERQRGLGLGLSIVDRAARLLDHEVTLRSQLGKGSSFGIVVPLAKRSDESVAPVVATPEHLHDDFLGRLIAVIENEGAIRHGMQNLLQAWGYKVIAADSAAAMLAQLDIRGREIDMVISDFGLRGGQSGVEAISALRQRYGMHLPALLFTGDISKETYALAKAAGVQILYKPAKPEALRAAITAAFELEDVDVLPD